MVDESVVDVGRPVNNLILHEPLSLRQFVAENMGRRGSVGDDRACPRQQAREIVPCHMGHGLSPWDVPGDRMGSPSVRSGPVKRLGDRSEEHTSELQSLMRISYAVFCLKKKKQQKKIS